MHERNRKQQRHSLEERLRIGRELLANPPSPQASKVLAQTLGVSERTLRNYKKLAREGVLPQRPPGRPPVLREKEQEVREAVRAILEADKNRVIHSH